MVRLIALIISIVLQILASVAQVHEDKIPALMDPPFIVVCFYGSPQDHSAF
jgi:hypothetical protein